MGNTSEDIVNNLSEKHYHQETPAPIEYSHSSSDSDAHKLSFMYQEFFIHGKVVINCKIPNCDYQSDKKSNFKRHFETMHHLLDPPIECCNIKFLTKGDFRHHSKSIHQEGHRCSICKKLFNRKALLERHMSIHTGSKPYKCSKCDYASANKANVIRHLTTHGHGDASIVEDNLRYRHSSSSTSCSLLHAQHDDSFNESINERSSVSSTPSQISPSQMSSSPEEEVSSPLSSIFQDRPNFKTTLNAKKTLISHSIESILSKPYTIKAERNQPAAEATIFNNNPTLPIKTEDEIPYGLETRKKSIKEVNEGENWSKINEDWTNWSHTSPLSCHQSNGYPSVALFQQQQYPPTSFIMPLTTGINPFYETAPYLPFFSNNNYYNNRYGLGDGTPCGVNPFNNNMYNQSIFHKSSCDDDGINNNVQKQVIGSSIVPDCSINQDLRFVPDFFKAKSCNFTSSVTKIPIVTRRHKMSNKSQSVKAFSSLGMSIISSSSGGSGSDTKYIEGIPPQKGNQENGPKKRVFMNESPPVPFSSEPSQPDSFNSDNTDSFHHVRSFKREGDNYIPKKLRLSKKFGTYE